MGDRIRKQERIEAQLFVDLIDPDTKESVGRGVLTDISESGFAIKTETKLDIDSKYLCHIEMPIEFPAKVMWEKTPGEMKSYGFKHERNGFFDKIFIRRILKGNLKSKKI